MSIVIGVGASHTTLMNTHWDAVAHLDRAIAFRDRARRSERAASARPVPTSPSSSGPNHFRGLWLDLMPAFLLGVGDVIAAGEHGTPEGPAADRPAARAHAARRTVADGFDLAFSARA